MPSHRDPSLASSHHWCGARTQSVYGLRRRWGSRMSRPNDDAERLRSSHTAPIITYTVAARISTPRPSAGTVAAPTARNVRITTSSTVLSTESTTRSKVPKNRVLREKVRHSRGAVCGPSVAGRATDAVRGGSGCPGGGRVRVVSASAGEEPAEGIGRVRSVSEEMGSAASHGGVGFEAGVLMASTLRTPPWIPRQSWPPSRGGVFRTPGLRGAVRGVPATCCGERAAGCGVRSASARLVRRQVRPILVPRRRG